MNTLDRCRQIIDTESGRILLYRDEVEAVLTAGDTISRQAVLNFPIRSDHCDRVNGNENYVMGIEAVMEYVKQLPSAQPEKRTNKRTETHSCDCISRQDAIDALHAKISEVNEDLWELEGCQRYCEMVSSIGTVFDDIPSVQPEIIRCKDCKYWGKRWLCEKWDYYISNEDFYCGCAERRTDERHDIPR